MLILRHVEKRDLHDLVALARQLDSMNLPGDPEFVELVPRGQNIQNEIGRKKRDSDQPKLRSDQIRPAICPRGLGR